LIALIASIKKVYAIEKKNKDNNTKENSKGSSNDMRI